MRRPPLRWMLLAPIALTLSIGGIALGIFVERSVRQDLIATVDGELARAANAIRGLGGPGQDGPGPAASSAPPPVGVTSSESPLELVIDNGTVISQRTPGDVVIDEGAVLELDGASTTTTIDGSPRYRALAAIGPNGRTTVTALSLERVDQSLASLNRNMLVGGLVLFAAQVLAIWFISGAVARPVRRMSAVAHDIAAGDLDAAVGPPKGPQETADLGADLGLMLERLRFTIAEQQESAAQANRARANMERFMADASHELRTPLTALKGYSDLYRGGMLESEGLDRAMERVGSESERLTELVIGLLQLMRDKHHETGTVDVVATASRVVDDLSAAHPTRAITLDAVDAQVLGDTNRLHQAVLNLGANACHHTAADSPIQVAISTDDDHVHVAVIDHGDGVDIDTAESLFVAFARGDASRSRMSHDGAGLGLALVQRIAEEHGGKAWVRDTPGGGATFGMSLPVLDVTGPNNPVNSL